MFFFSILIAKVSIILQSAIFLLKKVQRNAFFLQKQGDTLNFTHTTSIHTGDVGVLARDAA